MTISFAFMLGYLAIFGITCFQGQQRRYLLYFVVFNIVLTFAILLFGDRNFEKRIPNKSHIK